VSETHGYCTVAFRFTCCIYRILALGLVGTHSHLSITDYKYRYTARKTDYLIGLLIRHAHTPIWWIFVSKGHLPQEASDRRSGLARHENILATGVRATNFSVLLIAVFSDLKMANNNHNMLKSSRCLKLCWSEVACYPVSRLKYILVFFLLIIN